MFVEQGPVELESKKMSLDMKNTECYTGTDGVKRTFNFVTHKQRLEYYDKTRKDKNGAKKNYPERQADEIRHPYCSIFRLSAG